MSEVTVLLPEWLLAEPPAPPRRGMAVILRGARVEAIVGAAEASAGAPAIPLPGAALLPGLIDAHVHLTLCGCGRPRQTMMEEDDSLLLLRAADNARRALHAGITTVRDCGDRAGLTFRLRDALRKGIGSGPALILSGPPLTMPRGHCYFMGGEVEGRDSMARRIAALAASGADFIKVMATGGGLTPGTCSLSLQFPQEDLAFLTAEAARHGSYLAAHAHSPESIAACATAGVRTIEHATFAAQGGVRADGGIVERLAAAGAAAVPTCVPAELAVGEGRTLGLAREIGVDSAAFLDGRRAAIEALIRGGVPVLAGSDAGATGVPFDSLPGEIGILAGSGMTNLEAIAAATSAAASHLGLEGAGRIATGAPADLLAVAGNPAEDISALRRPVLVIRGGAVIRREPL